MHSTIKAQGDKILKETGCSVYEKKEAEHYLNSCRVISLYECDYSVLQVLTIVYKESNKTCGDCC